MDGLPQRLKEQRVLLKLTQEQFAEGCGLKRRAQAAYESGDRVPDADYLIRAARLGADLKYLLTSVSATDIEREKLAIEWFVREICIGLEVPAEICDRALARAANIDSAPPDDFGKEFVMKEIVYEVLRRSKRLNSVEVQPTLDRDLLIEVIREQEAAWLRTGKEPSAVQKSHRIAMLYHDAARSGSLNPNLIEGGVVKAARSNKAA